MRIRPVEAGDVEQVVRVVSSTLAEFSIAFGQGSPTDAQLLGLPGSYTREGGAFFVAVAEGTQDVVGTAGIAPIAPGIFELRKMYLIPAARGHGAARGLFEACLKHARAHGARSVVLDTTEQMTSAIAFYERNGFIRDDAQRRAERCSRGYRLDLT